MGVKQLFLVCWDFSWLCIGQFYRLVVIFRKRTIKPQVLRLKAACATTPGWPGILGLMWKSEVNSMELLLSSHLYVGGVVVIEFRQIASPAHL